MMSTVAVVLHTASFVARNKVVVERLLPSLKLVSSFLKVSFDPLNELEQLLELATRWSLDYSRAFEHRVIRSFNFLHV
jgi:hypothetical protein